MPTKTIRALNKPLSKQKAETAEKKVTAARPKAAPARRTRTAAKPAKAAPAEAAAPIQPEISWKRMDLHLHTPASHDYEQPEKGYLDILKQAERRGLDMIAFTDHNTANGYRNMTREIEDLELLERLGRIRPDELG
ncbi:MAG TPA: PHP domain-containing protein, partial [Thermoflexales bacterium]|nr:PHP domain-containing protein [Thermoflexales bacterium]